MWGLEMNLGIFGGCTIMTRKIGEDLRNGEGGQNFFLKWHAVHENTLFYLFLIFFLVGV